MSWEIVTRRSRAWDEMRWLRSLEAILLLVTPLWS